jgi:acyl-CoA:6-aminopenicillanic acid acyl transferase
VIVTLQKGEAGEFYNVTWPGLSGVFQGMAPGRFAASLNQAPMQRHRLTYAGDWIKNRREFLRSGGLPPAHLLRTALETAADYDEAKEMLTRTPVAMPIIYILGGIQDGKGCVVERTEQHYAIRPIAHDRVCAANHFETNLDGTGHGWRPRPIDSVGRSFRARTLPLATVDDRFAWFRPPIANAHSRVVMMACAMTGKLSVFGTQGEHRVTEEFHVGPRTNTQNE